MPRFPPAACALVLLLSLGDEGRAAQGAVPFPLELACGMSRLSAVDRPALAPDGAHLAYGVVSAGEAPPADGDAGAPAWATGQRLLVADTETGVVQAVGDAHLAAWAPSWSPDGRTLAFYAATGAGDAGLYTWRVGASAPVRLGSVSVATAQLSRPEWTPDGATLLLPAVAASAVASAEVPEPAAPSSPAAVAAPAAVASERTATASTVEVRTVGVERAPPAASDPAAAAQPGAMAGQSLVAGPPAALVEIAIADGRESTIVPAGDAPAFIAAQLSPSGRFLACESALRTGPGPALEVFIDLTIVRRADGVVVHEARGLPLDPNLDPTGPTLVTRAWHPTADRLAYLAGAELRLVDLVGETPKVSLPALGPEGARAVRLAFSRDGATLLVSLAAADAPVEDPALAGVRVVPIAGPGDAGPADAEPRELTAPAGLRLRGIVTSNGRAWQPSGAALVGVGTELATGDAVYLRMPLDGAAASVMRRLAGSMRIVAAGQDRAVARIEDATTAPDLYLVGPDFEQGVRLSAVEPRLAGVHLGTAHEIEAHVAAGSGAQRVPPEPERVLRGSILLPPAGAAGGPWPTLIALYPGASLRGQGRSFGGGEIAMLPAAAFTTRGYAVLLADVPLAPLGVASEPLDEIRAAVLAQVQRAVELGYADPERIGAIGHSFGAYGAVGLAATTDILRAAVAIDGLYDLPGVYAMRRKDEPELEGTCLNMLLIETHQGRMGKPLWEDPQRYVRNSPYFLADHIRIPLLLAHGGEDTNCPVSESEKLFQSLVRLGGSAQLAVYPGEGHVPDEWSRANRLDLLTRTLAFFDRHLARPHDDGG
jgi:dipeptidyl aminopeptidase/acylaminoacyl peptidase